jgi:uncharacterized protein (DUF885 family)
MLTTRRTLLAGSSASLALLGASAGQTPPTPIPTPTPATHAEALAAFCDRVSTALLQQSPQRCTSLGVSEARAGGRYIDKLDDVSREATQRYRLLLQGALSDLAAIDRSALNPKDQVTYDVVNTAFANQKASRAFDCGGGAVGPYVVSQLTGAYQSVPDFMDNQHPLRSRDDADAYVARLDLYPGVLDTETSLIGADAADGIAPPDFVIDRTLEQLGAFAAIAPAQTVLVTSLARRLPNIAEISEADRSAYLARAEAVVADRIMPAYQRQMEALRAQRPNAVHDAGVARLPQGEQMYLAALRQRTTVSTSPEEIHAMGLELIASLQAEMDRILKAHGMTRGAVSDRMGALALRRDQLYPNTEAGKQQILDDLNARTRAIVALMPQAFTVLAHAQLEIRRVPATIEAGAPGGYYQRASLDGSRPGAYYINLRDTAEWPRFKLPTLNYHEGVPGHHWQISISQESGAAPFIRSALLSFSGFTEGWGLYAEQLADELGVYENDPLGKLGFLQSATFRASRLVCDTGLHAKGWSREQAIQSMHESTGDKFTSITTEIERYCVQPGQACAYMLGRQTINRLRQDGAATLGARFDLKAYHDLLMANGAVPLNVLDNIVHDWAARPN